MIGLRVLLTATLVSLVMCSCGSSPSGPSANVTTVSGRVLDLQTNAAVSGATVVLADPSNTTTMAERARATTDGGGSFQMQAAAARYAIYVDSVYSGQAIVHQGANRIDLLARWNDCIARYGTVADNRTGRPVAGATVSLLGISAVTGSDGTYRLDFGCQGGRWSNTIVLLVTRAGYEDGAVPMGRGEGFSAVVRQDVDLVPR